MDRLRPLEPNERVECHSGAQYGERPVAIQWQGERFEVAEILDRWRSPDGRGFRVLTQEQRVFELFYREQDDLWMIRFIS